MSWIHALCETYDNYMKNPPENDNNPLVEVGFIKKSPEIIIKLKQDGTFHSAEIIDKITNQSNAGNNYSIITPSTPAAEGRTGTTYVPYPLCDELQYFTPDLDLLNKCNGCYDKFINNLNDWCSEPDAPNEICILRDYLEKRTLVADICSNGYEKTDLLNKDKAGGKLVDFQIHNGSQFVSISEIPQIKASWQKYFNNKSTLLVGETNFCYSSGQIEAVSYNHPKVKEKAKLISAKGEDFQFKGRFKNKEQAFSFSYNDSQKVTKVISWLSERQGFKQGNGIFLTWNTDCIEIIRPESEEDFGDDESSNLDEIEIHLNTDAEYAGHINQTLKGYRNAPEYKESSRIVMLGLENATKGRMSITFYEEFNGKQYLELLSKWYANCYWVISNDDANNRAYKEHRRTPYIKEIAKAVFGANDSSGKEKLIKRLYEDIFRCIAHGKRLPIPYANAAYHNILKPMSFKDKNGKWNRTNWKKNIEVTLAMLKNSYEKEVFKVALDTKNTDRSYLYGRLLAVADYAEKLSMEKEKDKDRQTNAVRYFAAIQQRPAVTWQNIIKLLQPYLPKIYSTKLKRNLQETISEIYHIGTNMGDNSPLTHHFLEGYYNQLYALNHRDDEQQNILQEA